MADPAPVTTRRREVRSDSARSLLLTVLGEFAHPRDQGVWTGTLVEALGLLGVEEKSARQALSRTAQEGIVVPTRHGRRALWELTPSGRALLQEGTERIYGFMRSRHPWDGEWLVLSVPIPETQRQLRHRLRTRLTWLGLGSPTSGLWVSPDTDKAADAAAVVEEFELTGQAFMWTGRASALGDEQRLLSQAWDLAEVRQRYDDFLGEHAARSADDPADAFTAQVELVQGWRRFPFLDPDLPVELLDDDWPGPRAAAVFHAQHERWHRRAQAEWDRMDAAHSERS